MKQLLAFSLLILLLPNISIAKCFEADLDIQKMGELKIVLSCFESQINDLVQQNKILEKRLTQEGDANMVNTVRGLPEPQVSASTVNSALKIKMDILNCKRKLNAVTCYFQITNKGNDEDFYFNDTSRVFDEFGEEYKSGLIDIGGISENLGEVGNVGKHLISGLPTRGSITFNNIPKQSTQLAAINIDLNGERLKLRNVIITE